MTVADRLTYYWSEKIAKIIANKTKSFLENQKDLLGGDDTCLENNWEEYCIQVQGDEWIFAGEAYINHIESLFENYYNELAKEEQFTLWLESQDGQDWYWQDENRDNIEFTYEQAPVFFDDCVKLIMSELNEIAMNFENDNITNYIEYNCNGIENDELEEEDE